MNIILIPKEENYLSHHGILGQKWGKRNGPPYPLDSNVSTGHRLKDKGKKKLSKEEKKKSGRDFDGDTGYKSRMDFMDEEDKRLVKQYSQYIDNQKKYGQKKADEILNKSDIPDRDKEYLKANYKNSYEYSTGSSGEKFNGKKTTNERMQQISEENRKDFDSYYKKYGQINSNKSSQEAIKDSVVQNKQSIAKDMAKEMANDFKRWGRVPKNGTTFQLEKDFQKEIMKNLEKYDYKTNFEFRDGTVTFVLDAVKGYEDQPLDVVYDMKNHKVKSFNWA